MVKTRAGTLIAVVTIVAGGSVVLPVVPAQPGEARVDSPGLTDVDIQVSMNQSTRVVATYQVRMPSTAAQGDGWLNGTLWSYENSSIENLSASVGGHTVDPIVTSNLRHDRLSLPVDPAAETTTVRIEYIVDASERRVKIPLWVPTLTPAGNDQTVSIQVRFPPGPQYHDVTFPTPVRESANGRIAQIRLRKVPGFLAITHESDMSDRETLESFIGHVFRDVGEVLSGLPTIPPETRLGSQLLSFTIVALGYLTLSVVLVRWMESRTRTEPEESTDPSTVSTPPEGDK